MATETVENYLKAIDALERERAPSGKRTPRDGKVSLGAVAAAVGVTPGTATTMVKGLAQKGLARYERYAGVRLTPKGQRMALAVLRRHRLIETFLVRTLGMDWGDVHEEAERLEHGLSDRLIDRLDQFLGRPAVDPHGDPIPDADGKMREPSVVSAAACADRTRGRVARVLDQRPEFLHFLSRHGLTPGASVVVEETDEATGTVRLNTGRGKSVVMARTAASNLMVQPEK